MWWWLIAAMVSEVGGTVALRMSEGFTRIGPVIAMLVGYLLSFYFLSQALTRGMGLGTAYAIWSAVGICAIASLSVWLFGDTITRVQVAGMALIVVGIVIVQLGGATHR